jgi:hypothetical protein
MAPKGVTMSSASRSQLISQSFQDLVEHLETVFRQLMNPNKVSVDILGLKIDYEPSKIREDASQLIAFLTARKVLYQQISHELWTEVFRSLDEISRQLVALQSRMAVRGPGSVADALAGMIRLIGAYVGDFENSFRAHMANPLKQDLVPPHRERDWPILGDAGDALASIA